MNVIHLTWYHSADLLKKIALGSDLLAKVTIISYEFSLCASVCTAVCVLQ